MESLHGFWVNPHGDFYIQRPATSQVYLMLQFGWLLRSIPGSIAFAAIGAQTSLHLTVRFDTRP
jgi:hypothetical protein